ncbi:hypothetical protein P8C59_000600 [Phyllachora maydis]|uniref:Exocyst complex component SEC5 n=1 Tax=Phyllachora maydis TaxID=1825666 RepID=A0AAD9HWQ2_9PEZI|nr:hypothetical protein P8C59_000600 [Phyllachora maydis]
MAAETERTVLDFYGIPNLNPMEWPADKNNSDDSEEEDMRKKANKRKSRYQALERAVVNRNSVVPGSENGGKGVGNIVQRDEPDPLGSTESVVRTLKQLGVPVQDDIRLRNRFLLSSTTFSPALFLSQMHATADTQSLLLGLDTLSQSIDQKSASLKVLVESNFERFVRAKSVIDNVYKEMNFRNSSVSGAQPLSPPLANDPRKRNALIKESEYGVMGIKAPLLDVSAKAEDVWGPALGGREKEEVLRTVSSSIEQFREYVELSAAIAESIKRKDHDTLVEEYVKARRFADEAKLLAQQVGNAQADESRLYKVLIAARMWHDVDEQIQAFKRDVWRRLISIHTLSNVDTGSGLPQDQHMELISLLLELGVEDNPVWVWLLSRYDYLKGKVQATAERLKMEIEILRRRLANADKPAPQLMATHLKAVGRPSMASKTPAFDQADIVELWEKMVSFLTGLLSSQGIVGEVLDFWRTVDGFVDGRLQKSLPNGYNGESLKHHGLSPQGITELQKGVVELVNMIREHAMEFFAGPPPDDISALLSPTVLTPRTPLSSLSEALSPTMAGDPRFDANNLPPVSPRRGEAWEKFAFWPPWSNSISGVHYLSRMLALVGSGASDMASMTPVARGDPAEVERLKTLVGASRERCVTALSAAWNRDAENIKFVEDWHRSSDHKDVTKMPVSFATFEGTLLSGMQKILYISDATTQPGAEDIVLSPPTKLLQMVRSQYVTTLYKALSGMVENAERSVKKADDDWTTDVEGFTAPGGALNGRVSTMGGGTINAGDRNVRMLLTLSNLQSLRSEVVPGLNTQFENAFSVKLTDESKTIRDVLGQIDARLFQSYTRPSIDILHKTIRAGVTAPDWAPPPGERPREVKPYVYEALLALVLVHTQVSTTAGSLTNQVLSYLLEQTSRELYEAFRARARYDLEALMQATLDVEFVAQTLNQYTTDRASELQQQIYQELDARTDNDARARLQTELPEMRNVLKRLREAAKSEFACFRKPKRAAAGAGGSSGAAVGGITRRDTGASAGSDGPRV